MRIPKDIDTTEAWTTKSDNGFWGSKIDWQINDDHLLELLAFSDKAPICSPYVPVDSDTRAI